VIQLLMVAKSRLQQKMPLVATWFSLITTNMSADLVVGFASLAWMSLPLRVTQGLFKVKKVVRGAFELISDPQYRVGLMFYELNTDDKWGDNPWKRDESAPSLTGTFKGDTNVFAAIVNHLEPEVKFAQEEHIEDSDSSSTMANLLANTKASDVETRSVVEHLLPDG
jgi:hypothetical protein